MSSLTETLIPAAPEVVMPERVTPLRPSEALRLGRLTRPMRIRGRRFGLANEACALGAIATGGDEAEMSALLFACSAWCPFGCRDHRRDAYNTTWHLNDQHRWSDDQIVAWLESLNL